MIADCVITHPAISMEQTLLYREARRQRSFCFPYLQSMLKYTDLHLILQLSKSQALPAASSAGESVGIWMKFTISKQAITVRIF